MQMQNHKAVALGLTAAIMACAGTVRADDQELLDKIKKLEDRVNELEGKGPQAEAVKKNGGWEAWLGATKFSGFVSGSYLYNFNRPSGLTPSTGGAGGGGAGVTDYTRGRSFDGAHNEFAINKLKLALEKPVEWSGENFDAGYRADLIFGQDAHLIQSSGLSLGNEGDLEQIYATVNLPVGRGLQVSFGKMVTLMGVEVIEETVNPNWSEGNQFLYVENFAGAGAQLAYKFSDKVDAQFRILNGWDVVKDNNNALSYMGRVGFAPNDKTSLAVIGYGGPEQANNSAAWRRGIDLVASLKVTPKLTLWGQGDYGREDQNAALPVPTQDASWWAAGAWATYDFNDKIGVAVRGDYLDDIDGARTSAAPGTAPFPVNTGQHLSSLTVTLNLRPYKSIQIRPELRYDYSNKALFGSGGTSDTGEHSQLTAAVGVAYIF
jgi:hypothetical protein